jgi:hypothetical protein
VLAKIAIFGKNTGNAMVVRNKKYNYIGGQHYIDKKADNQILYVFPIYQSGGVAGNDRLHG